MPTTIDQLLEAAAAQTVPVVRGVENEQLDAPTPCPEFRVKDLLNHLFHVVVNFQALAARQSVDFSVTPDYLRGDWRDRFAVETRRLIEAWSDPAALQGVSEGMGLPQEIVGKMALLDLIVHGWDLATATGQSYTPDAASVASGHDFVEVMGSRARAMGVFGEPTEVAPDAGEFDRLLALTGRRHRTARER